MARLYSLLGCRPPRPQEERFSWEGRTGARSLGIHVHLLDEGEADGLRFFRSKVSDRDRENLVVLHFRLLRRHESTVTGSHGIVVRFFFFLSVRLFCFRRYPLQIFLLLLVLLVVVIIVLSDFSSLLFATRKGRNKQTNHFRKTCSRSSRGGNLKSTSMGFSEFSFS